MRVLAALLLTAGLAAAQVWHDTLPAAKKQARARNMPVLCVLVTTGDKASDSLRRALDRKPEHR